MSELDFLIHNKKLNRPLRKLLKHRGIETQLAQDIGFAHPIRKGSFAARLMSAETRACGGQLRSMEFGGLSAALSSIGTSGSVKPEAAENVESFQDKVHEHRSRQQQLGNGRVHHPHPLPSYWVSSSGTDVEIIDYSACVSMGGRARAADSIVRRHQLSTTSSRSLPPSPPPLSTKPLVATTQDMQKG
jgi:hypothetical protein